MKLKIVGFDLFVNFLKYAMHLYINLKTKFYEIAVILASVGILFHDDSTFCSEVTWFERNLGVSHFHRNI